MSLFTWLRIRLWPPHHRNDPRLHPDAPPELILENEWFYQSTEKHLSASERQWIDLVIEQASKFPLDCFIRFEYRPEQRAIVCYRVKQMNQPGLELGTTNNVGSKHWEYFWKFVYDHFDSSLKLEPLEGEEKREFVIWTSPNHKWDTYSLTPNAISIKLCILYPSTSDYKTPWCGLDGPCTAH